VALVVDDDNDLLTFMYEELSADYRVLRARDGVEALEVMKEELPDIVCSDIMMPNMDGIELCKHIKSDKRMSSIPVILLSSKYNLDTKFDGLTAGADDYLTKPFNLDVLRLRMQKMIELRRNNHYDIGDESDDDGKDESRNGSGSSESVAEAEVTADEEAVGENKAAESKLLNDVNEYINANISCTELSVEDLMNNVCVGLSKGTFYKELRSITGRTPIEYIRKIRMEKAAEYFKNTDMNISEIAYKVGYNSPHFFTVQFKREFGVTPSVYIEKLGK
jgi:YesN/AraC family two-component response regulator